MPDMDENEVRNIISKVESERLERQVKRGTFCPEAEHYSQHKWLGEHIEFRKTLRKRIIFGAIAAIFTVLATIYGAKYIGETHTHYPDNPEIKY